MHCTKRTLNGLSVYSVRAGGCSGWPPSIPRTSPLRTGNSTISTTYTTRPTARTYSRVKAAATIVYAAEVASAATPTDARANMPGGAGATENGSVSGKKPFEHRPPLEKLPKEYTTILSMDGGILRGIITGCVLEEIENAIKERMIALGLCSKPGFTAASDFDICLGEWFDLIAGTSTGSILATYLASCGGKAQHFLDSDDDILELAQSHPDFSNLQAGSARAAQAVYLAKAKEIFRKLPKAELEIWFKEWKESVSKLATDYIFREREPNPKKVDKGILNKVQGAWSATLDSVFSTLSPATRPLTRFTAYRAISGLYQEAEEAEGIYNFFESKYKADGLMEVLKGVFGCQRTAAFWYDHDTHDYGLATLARLSPNPDIVKDNMPQVDRTKLIVDRAASVFWYHPIDFELWQLPNASSRAPTYLPPTTLKVPAEYLGQVLDDPKAMLPLCAADGGLTSNDPTTISLATALQMARDPSGADNNKPVLCKDLEKMAVLSIGCGTAIDSANRLGINIGEERKFPYGKLGWIMGPLVDIFTGGNEEMNPVLVGQLLGSFPYAPTGRYLRIQKALVEDLTPPASATAAGPAATPSVDAAALSTTPINVTIDSVPAPASPSAAPVTKFKDDWLLKAVLIEKKDGQDVKVPIIASQAIQNADDPRYVYAMLEVGRKLADEKKTDIHDYVEKYIFASKTAASTQS